ncbi:MAG TPA: glutathione peroxidase [Phycisphaerae bacterium]|nr:glutathione peroxidase [Phycisphaerae bacterium]
MRNASRLRWSIASILIVLATATAGVMSMAADPEPTKNQSRKPDSPRAKKSKKKKKAKPTMPALSFKMKDIDGKTQDLRKYHGNVVMIVNVATYCGLTPQYEQLQAIYEKYEEQGFVILAFPANNFGRQEPDPNEKIKQFCTTKFFVTFPMFAKVSVKGDDICALYKYLTNLKAAHGKGGEIDWNFAKFMVNRRGEVVERFKAPIKPDAPEVTAAIEKYLAAKIPPDSPLAKKKTDRANKKAKKRSA